MVTLCHIVPQKMLAREKIFFTNRGKYDRMEESF
jgi:hypothetical protein